ncbi:hornerin-like isoform X2 [Penaeus chinensis]|uniref:hornerin-like isoform X2 n=1 Tax=Penaeus chinensis TaxID=139456 RepID=UPI001FB7E24F|nr:hornerin-like isoform X2 [Penaeus chinensis]
MAGRHSTSLMLVLTCLAAVTAGVDNDVQKVTLPQVVKYPLRPLMEVLSQGGPREMRAATFPGIPSGCLSCTAGGLGASTYGSSYSSGSFGSDGGFSRPGLLRPVSDPQGNSYKHEVRSESKIVNGQPVYDLYHERRFEDGHLVHEERKEKGAKDVDTSFGPGQGQGYPGGPGYSRHLHETHLQSSSVGSSDYGSAGTLSARGDASPHYNSDVSSLSERLRQQMLLLKNRKGHETPGGSHHAVYSQTRYVNGQPVYVKKEERKYEDGQLVYNKTDEKGPDDLGTRHVAQQYDASGSPVGPGDGFYERREEQRHFSSSSQGSQALYPGTYPGHAPTREGSPYHRQDSAYPSYRAGYNSGSTGSREETSSNYRPYRPTAGSSSTQYTQESREETSSGYRPYRPTSGGSSTQYTHESREETSSGYRPYRPTSGGSSTQYTQESTEETSSNYRPTSRGSSTQHTQESREETSSGYRPYRPTSGGSSTQYTQESTEETSSGYRPYRPTSGSSSTQYTQESREETSSNYRPTSRGSSTQHTQESREETSSGYRPYRPTSGGSSTQYTQQSTEETSSNYRPYRPISGSSSTQYTQESREETASNYRPTSGGSSTQHTQESREETSSGYRPYRPTSGSSSTQHTQESREETSSGYRPYRPTSGSSSTQYTQESRDETSSGYRPYRPTSGGSSTQYTQESTEETSSGYRPYRPTSGSSSTQHTQESREETSSGYRPYRPTSGGSSTQYTQESTEETSSNYRPYRPTSGSSSTQYTQESREETASNYRPYRPTSGSSSTQYTQESREETASNYRPYRPTSGSSSTQYTQESREGTSSGYRPYRPTSGGSSTQHTQESREETSSGYRPYRPTSGSSTQNTQETREEWSSGYTPVGSTSSSSRPDSSSTQYTHESREESLSSRKPHVDRWTHAQQTDEELNLPYRPDNRPSSSSTHYAQDSREDTSTTSQYTQESTEEPTYPSRPSYRPSGTTSHNREESYESSWQQRRRDHTYTPPSGDFHTTIVQQNTRQPETTTQSALDSSRRDGSSEIYSQNYEQSSSARRGYNAKYDQHQQGVSSHNSQEASAGRRLTTDEGRDTVGIPGVLSGPHTQYGDDEKHNKERYDISPLEDNGPELPSVDNEFDSSYVPTLAPVDSEIDSSVNSERRPEPAIHTDRQYHNSRQDTSRTDTHSQARPSHGYSDSSYHYQRNRTSTQGAINSVPASTPAQASDTDDASSYGYPGVEGTSRYHYNESWRHSTNVDSQPQPPYGSTSSSSSSSQVRNCGQVSCIVVGDGHLSSSRQTQTRVSTRYVNGELVGITHHIRQYEDGKLVHENRTEQSVDDLSEEDLRRYGIDQLHLVQGSYQPESYSQRHEVRQEKKYVNGEQIYDLHHERRFEDGSLVYENRTEKDPDDLGISSPGGYEGSYSHTQQEGGARHEVTQSQHLQQHVTSGAVGDITAGQASESQQVTDTAHVSVVPVYTSRRYETRRQQEFVDGQPTYDLHHERHFNNGSLVYENKTELNEGELRASHSPGHQDALHQILSGNTLSTAYDGSSSATAHGSYGSASYHGSESSRQTGVYGESASSQLGGSYSGSLSQDSGTYGGIGSSFSSSSSSESHESSMTSGFPAGHGASSSRATTSVLGAGSFSGSSQQESSGGCLSCMLIGGSGFSDQGSLGVSGSAGADGYNHRQEMNMEEHYEDGQLIHGQEESRVFENGQLVHESQRQYADAPGQSYRASALQSAKTSSVEAGSCETSYCKNGGTCISGFMGPLCTCPFGFKGKDCSEAYCPKRFCRYGGSCQVEGARHVCVCEEGYTGYRCQSRTYRHARRHASKP